jgi:hypothetical protein
VTCGLHGIGLDEKRERQGGVETSITRIRLRPYDTLTGLKVVSLRHTGAATIISSRGGPVPFFKGGREGGDRVYGVDSHGQGGGRKVSRGGRGRGTTQGKKRRREATLPLVLCLDILVLLNPATSDPSVRVAVDHIKALPGLG